MDPGYRRLRYIRYADDHILGFIGPKAEAEQIKARLAAFLRETLGLELNQDKTLITHARSQPARFLGYDITVQHCDTQDSPAAAGGQREDRAAGAAGRGQGPVRPLPAARQTVAPARLQNLDDYDIVRIYGAEYRGVVNYYLLAQDVWRLHHPALARPDVDAEDPGRQAPLLRHQDGRPPPGEDRATSDGPRTCFEARLQREGKKDLVARFGGIILRQDRRAVITDPAPVPACHPAQGADPQAPQAAVRAVRARHHGDSSPGRRAPASSGNPGRASQRGRPSWRECGARRSSSARRATSTSTPARSRTRHKSLESPVR